MENDNIMARIWKLLHDAVYPEGHQGSQRHKAYKAYSEYLYTLQIRDKDIQLRCAYCTEYHPCICNLQQLSHFATLLCVAARAAARLRGQTKTKNERQYCHFNKRFGKYLTCSSPYDFPSWRILTCAWLTHSLLCLAPF